MRWDFNRKDIKYVTCELIKIFLVGDFSSSKSIVEYRYIVIRSYHPSY